VYVVSARRGSKAFDGPLSGPPDGAPAGLVLLSVCASPHNDRSSGDAMILQRYILRQLLTALLFAVGGLLFVLLPAILVNAVHKVGSAGLYALAKYLPLLFADLLPYILPLGFLLAVVSTFGRLAADRELTAIRMAGINPAKLMLPCVAVAALLGAGNNWIASSLAPNWKYMQRNYKRQVLESAVRLLSPGRTEVRIPGFFLKAARRDPVEPAVFYEAHISVFRKGEGEDPGSDLWMYADRVGFVFEGDLLHIEMRKARMIKGTSKIKSDSPTLTFDMNDLLEPTTEDRDRPKFLPSEEMQRRIDEGEVEGATVDQYTYEIHRRYALSATYLLFLLIGLPTGIRLRSGTQLAAFAAAVGYAIVYYVLSLQLGRQLFVSGMLSAVAASWITNAIGCAFGLTYTIRVLRE
jgi:lipopolysaccharide export system permease protein